MRLEPVNDGTGLFPRTTMGLLNPHSFPRFVFPIANKGRIDLLIQFPSGIVGHVQNGRVGTSSEWKPCDQGNQNRERPSWNFHGCHNKRSFLSYVFGELITWLPGDLK